ncbi:MAG: hypothetical protein NVSMB22_06260 [Chloroflexota bacterium]
MRTVYVSVLALFLARRRRWWSAGLLVVGVGGAGIVNTVLKAVTRRERPERLAGITQAGGYSWPSGHTTGSFVFFGLLPVLVWTGTRRPAPTLGAAATSIVTTAFVARSRVVLHHHHETDVLGSYAVGAAWLAIVLKMFAGPLRRERG